ncbi:MAG: hypothetical protein IANPNBLG_04113 [Bryobacteraceae bacterium]|nr:hypothetical protein [Bryobacteraceae bacterium]
MAPRHRVIFVFPTKEYERTRTEVLIETFIRKQLRLKAHTVTKVEESDGCMLPGGLRHSADAGMAGPLDAEVAADPLLPPAAGRVSPVWRAGRGLSLGRAVGAGDDRAGQRRGYAGAGIELAGCGPPVRAELEKRGYHRETGGAVRAGASRPASGARDRHR